MYIFILFIIFNVASGDFPFRDPTLPWNKRVDDIVNRLTLEEIANQTMTGYRNPTTAITRLGINEYIWFSECIHGQMRTNSTSFPQSLGLAASFSKALLEKVAETIATEVRAHWNANRAQGHYRVWYGVSCFSPEMNLMRHPLWGRNQETYGEDPFLTGSMSVSYVQGLQGRHPRYVLVSSGCKAFDAYNGPENIPVRRFTFDAKITERDLRMTFLPAFKMCVEGGTYNIMCSYNSVNGVPSCVNKHLLTDILRTEWGFKGYVVSDDGAINGVWKGYNLTKSAAETSAMAIKAGCNLELGDEYIYAHQVEAMHQGLITEDELRDNIRPLFYTRLRLGEFDPEEMNPYNSIPPDVIQSVEHRKLAMHAAMMTFVLLKNSQLLPLRQTYHNIAIVGPMADNAEQVFGNYAPNIMPEYTVTPYKGLLALADKVSYAAGCDNTVCGKYEEGDIINAVSGSELVIVCLGTGPAVEQEDNDRSTLNLPGHQLQLLQDAVAIANGAPVILLLFNAGPLDITWAKYSPYVHAILECFFPAQSAGSAIFHMLTASAGPQSVPAARLPSTWPASLAQVPPMTSYSMENRTYRYAAVEALYPFGYGLSYSHFQYSGLAVQPTVLHPEQDLAVVVKVINLGPYDADEVVQVYISWPHAVVPVPRLQLVDFTRLTLAVYESHALEFIIPWQRLAVWVDNVGFTVPQGDMQVFVGGQQPFQATHADSNVLQATFSVLY